MRIAIFCAFDQDASVSYSKEIISILEKAQHDVVVDHRLKKFIDPSKAALLDFFDSSGTIASDVDFLFSVGGDGTLLRAIPYVKDSEIPIFGINTGRLGFLTSLQKESLQKGLNSFFDQKYELIERSLIEVKSTANIEALEDFGYALNEVCISRKNTTSMLTIDTQIDGRPLTTYWADGLIVATPTGSTGYSLSSGGPILTPDNHNWILNPIAPHNINYRPLIISDKCKIKIQVSGRGNDHLVALDSRIVNVKNDAILTLKKAAFSVFTVQLEGDTFFKTLREKLFWGIDTRNTQ